MFALLVHKGLIFLVLCLLSDTPAGGKFCGSSPSSELHGGKTLRYKLDGEAGDVRGRLKRQSGDDSTDRVCRVRLLTTPSFDSRFGGSDIAATNYLVRERFQILFFSQLVCEKFWFMCSFPLFLPPVPLPLHFLFPLPLLPPSLSLSPPLPPSLPLSPPLPPSISSPPAYLAQSY